MNLAEGYMLLVILYSLIVGGMYYALKKHLERIEKMLDGEKND